MATVCFNGVPAPTCELTCEELTCEINAIKANITNLFNRTDDLNEYISDSQWVIVTTDDQLTEALEDGGTIFILGTITRAAGNDIGWTVGVPGTKLIGLSDDSQSFAKVVNPHSASDARTVFNVATYDVEIRNLDITTNHPLTSDTGIVDIGVVTFGAVDPYNTSGLVIDNCKLHHLTYPIKRVSGNGLPVQERGRITNNHIYSFVGDGILLDWGTDGMLIENNTIVGEAAGDTHDSDNGIWVGNGADNLIVRGNKISSIGRHGIEFWHSLAGQNNDAIITNNIIEDCLFGISALGNGVIHIIDNNIKSAKGIGIELVGQVVSESKFIVTGNHVDDTSFHVGQAVASFGISIDGVNNDTLISNNSIKRITSPGVLESAGLAFFNSGSNVTISNNTFVDAGTRMISIAAGGGAYNIIDVERNTFRYTGDYAAAYPSPTFTEWSSVLLANVGTISVRNNTVWYPSASPSFGIMHIKGTATAVYTGGASDAPLVTPPDAVIEESNVRIPY